jgi:hypothetical protein
MFNNLTKEKKIEILESAMPFHEQVLYESIIRLGLDPDEFDPDLFDGTEENFGPQNLEFCKSAQKAIDGLDLIRRQIESL